jgi:hypothetical protein
MSKKIDVALQGINIIFRDAKFDRHPFELFSNVHKLSEA